MKKFKVSIVIDGLSANELFAIGPNDLREYFLPERLNVKEEDVVHIMFQEDLSIEDSGKAVLGMIDQYTHKDNYFRDKGEE